MINTVAFALRSLELYDAKQQVSTLDFLRLK